MKTNITRTIVASVGLAFAVAACGGGGGMTPAAEPAMTPALSGTPCSRWIERRRNVQRRQATGLPLSAGEGHRLQRLRERRLPNSRVYSLAEPAVDVLRDIGSPGLHASVQAYPGNDFFAVRTYDRGIDHSGGGGGSSRVISTGSVVATIGANTSNTISIATSGVVSKLLIGLDTPLPAVGTPLTQPVHVAAFDADYNTIVGNFDQPLTLTDSDTTGVTTLSRNSIASSADVPTLSYTGGTLSTANITVTTASPSDSLNGGPFHTNIFLIPGGTGLWPSPSYLAFSSVTARASEPSPSTGPRWPANRSRAVSEPSSSTPPTHGDAARRKLQSAVLLRERHGDTSPIVISPVNRRNPEPGHRVCGCDARIPVETIARGLANKITGKTISGPGRLEEDREAPRASIREGLGGETILRSGAAKYVVLDLSSGRRLAYQPADDRAVDRPAAGAAATYAHVVLDFTDGTRLVFWRDAQVRPDAPGRAGRGLGCGPGRGATR